MICPREWERKMRKLVLLATTERHRSVASRIGERAGAYSFITEPPALFLPMKLFPIPWKYSSQGTAGGTDLW